jgi:Rps23 Pro-64 3,4-dihydroxylase Tpa1-like proline 4-hydroxylase
MITKYKDFFNDEICQELDVLISKIMSKENRDNPIYSASISSWDKELVSHSTPILRYFLTEENDKLISKIKKEVSKKTGYEIDYVLIHFFPKLSYITWHDDGIFKGAITVYLNKNWDSDWGGYLMYEEDSDVKAIKPEYNLGILQEGGVKHCVSTINVDADIRISIQAFLVKSKKLM